MEKNWLSPSVLLVWGPRVPLPGVPAHPRLLGLPASSRVSTVWQGLGCHTLLFPSGGDNCVPSAFGGPAWSHGVPIGHGGFGGLPWGLGVSACPREVGVECPKCPSQVRELVAPTSSGRLMRMMKMVTVIRMVGVLGLDEGGEDYEDNGNG